MIRSKSLLSQCIKYNIGTLNVNVPIVVIFKVIRNLCLPISRCRFKRILSPTSFTPF